MPRRRLSRATGLCLALVAVLAASAAAEEAVVKVNDIIIRADGGFQPRTLPRHRFVPIGFQGYFDIAAKGGGKPVALREAVIDFDRDGRLNTAGLPACSPERLAEIGVREGRKICGGAIVGSGRIEAFIELAGGGAVQGSSALTIYNGPTQEGRPTVVLHARTTVPETQTFAILVPIERRPGGFRYRARLVVPEIAGGRGSITRVEVDVGRRFTSAGKRRSYVSARCSDGILRTHGRFTFVDGTIVDGSVEKGCTAR
jgi:hypothetical protein